MSTTSTNKNLLVIIGVLLLTNIAVLVYFLGLKKPGKKEIKVETRVRMSDVLRKDVGFTDSQVAQYRRLKDAQWKTVKPMFDHMRRAKDSLFMMLKSDSLSETNVSGAADVIGRQQRALDLQTFEHFRRVREICTPEQLTKYDSVIIKMLRKMNAAPPRRPTDVQKK